MIIGIIILGGILCNNSSSLGQEPERQLSLWLIPTLRPDSRHLGLKENPDGLAKTPEEDVIWVWNRGFGEHSPVICENTVNPVLYDQLRSNNPEFSEPNWELINSQLPFLKALERFAKANRVQLRVRFIMWPRLLQTIKEGMEKGLGPDVAQVGSTWVAYFSQRNWLLPIVKGEDSLKLRLLPGGKNASLRWTIDLRLLFYFKNGDGHIAPDELKDWPTIIEFLKDIREARKKSGASHGPILLFPTGVTPNLWHDLAPLVSSGGGTLLDVNKSSLTLDDKALKIPELLAHLLIHRESGHESKLFAFPETGHEETSGPRFFLTGKYLATIEPAGFIVRWHSHLASQKRDSSINFWDVAGVMVPPKAFVGGSDLAIFKSSRDPELAIKLSRFLATDPEIQKILAQSGQLLAQAEDLGLPVLLAPLVKQAGSRGAVHYQEAVKRGLATGEEYPPFWGWPDLESRDVLESLQNFWRRIAEGNADGQAQQRLRIAARYLERKVNIKINLWDNIWISFISWWSYIAAFILTMAFLTILWGWRYLKQNRERRLALRLFAAKLHGMIPDAPKRLKNITKPKIPDNERLDWLKHYAEEFSQFNETLIAMSISIINEIDEPKHDTRDLYSILKESIDYAQLQYYINYGKICPIVRVSYSDELSHWNVIYPNLLKMITSEWIYNCLKHTPDGTIPMEFRLGKDIRGIDILSPLPEKDFNDIRKKLVTKPERKPVSSIQGGQGLELIRDLLYYCYKKTPLFEAIVEGEYPRARLGLPLPISQQ
jgi:ABC-type glycerol-3-phosphate transport system substrate-binding protein